MCQERTSSLSIHALKAVVGASVFRDYYFEDRWQCNHPSLKMKLYNKFKFFNIILTRRSV